MYTDLSDAMLPQPLTWLGMLTERRCAELAKAKERGDTGDLRIYTDSRHDSVSLMGESGGANAQGSAAASTLDDSSGELPDDHRPRPSGTGFAAALAWLRGS